jgi:heme oxygenase (biliverdin-IX-beta and delta-forming)
LYIVPTSERGRTHEYLRTTTRKAHEILDSRFDPSALSCRANYAQFLLKNCPIIPIEIALERAGIYRLLPDWDLRRRRGALCGDLRKLNVNPPDVAVVAIAENDGSLLGWAYVLEGSRLGASAIKKMISTLTLPDIENATKFLSHGLGKRFWNSFQEALARIDHDEAEIYQACLGAEAAFRCFLNC